MTYYENLVAMFNDAVAGAIYSKQNNRPEKVAYWNKQASKHAAEIAEYKKQMANPHG
jgi:hypothetical protein